jgi:hypothetical protein
MLNIEKILGQDRLIRAMTGLNRQAFEALLLSFAVEYERVYSTLTKSRQRARGAGAKAKLKNPQEKLFYTSDVNKVRSNGRFSWL